MWDIHQYLVDYKDVVWLQTLWVSIPHSQYISKLLFQRVPFVARSGDTKLINHTTHEHAKKKSGQVKS
jgi:hypothetical protein